MAEKKRRPELQFKGFTDDWEQRKVSEITAFHKQGFYTTETYDDGKKYYLLRGTDLTENRLVLRDTPRINATEKDFQAFKTQIGDFLIVRSGTVGTYGVVYEDIPAIFGSYLIDFRFDKSQVTNEFFGYFYQSDLFKNQLRQIIQQSANTNINAENIKSTSIRLPSIPEQKQIGVFFAGLDNLITLHQRKYEKLVNVKKSMLEKMFPQNGSAYPEVRFSGFTAPWEQRKLGDEAIEIVAGGDIDKSLLDEYGCYPVIANALTDDGVVGYYAKDYRIKAPAVTVSGRGDVGHAKARTVDFTPVVRLLSVRSRHDVFFLENAINTLNIIIESTGVPQLTVPQLSQYDILFPPTIEEEKSIGEFFDRIDNLITLHKDKLETLKHLKQSMLQKMFV